jgi:hypothetical protein
MLILFIKAKSIIKEAFRNDITNYFIVITSLEIEENIIIIIKKINFKYP